MQKIQEGRRSNVIYILGQIKGFLETLKGIEGYNIASIHDTVARQFAQALTDAGASDPYAVIRAVDEVSRVRGTGPIYTRIYRKYFHSPVLVSPEEANEEAEEGFEDGIEQAGEENIDWPEEISVADELNYNMDPEEDSHGPYADDLDDDEQDDFDHSEAYKDDINIARRDGYFESTVKKFIEGKDAFSQAYERATELLKMDGYTREAVEVCIKEEFKLIPEDINAIIDSITHMTEGWTSPDWKDPYDTGDNDLALAMRILKSEGYGREWHSVGWDHWDTNKMRFVNDNDPNAFLLVNVDNGEVEEMY